MFACVCQRLFAFARICLRPPLLRAPLCVTLSKLSKCSKASFLKKWTVEGKKTFKIRMTLKFAILCLFYGLFSRGCCNSTPQERKRHININLIGRWPLRWPGGLPTGRPGVKDLCAILGTQGTQIFLSGNPTGRTGDRGDRTEFYVIKLLPNLNRDFAKGVAGTVLLPMFSSFFSFFFRFVFPFSSFFSVAIVFLCLLFLSGSDFFLFLFSAFFLPFSSVSFSTKNENGGHRSRDPFCETPTQIWNDVMSSLKRSLLKGQESCGSVQGQSVQLADCRANCPGFITAGYYSWVGRKSGRKSDEFLGNNCDPMVPLQRSKWENRATDIFGVKKCLFGGLSRNHLNGLLGGFNSLP